MTNELLPCPFDGGEPKTRWTGGVFIVECSTCGVSKGDSGGEGDAIEQSAIAAWNRRANLGVVAEPVACSHEPYQGRCVHCDVKFVDGKPSPPLP